MSLRLTKHGAEALRTLVAAGELQLAGKAGWRAPDGTVIGHQTSGVLRHGGYATRVDNRLVPTGMGRQLVTGVAKAAAAPPPPELRLTPEQSSALSLLARHQRLVWSSECRAWETPVPYEWSSYATASIRAMQGLAKHLLVTVQTEMVAEITPDGVAAALRLGLTGGVVAGGP